ncbi:MULTISPECIES: hypothetical protein [unclassified Janthinobacterium]|uniref:hypothetical protein n=1 Tax=unclassified Janthinobacterium TaxID=2610881 RepID=UPI00160EF809|nr:MULTISPECIES: hypothetical protein [unclassified Janthinobacterium]MBB5608315.1 hypothetical protein [Janthinobacterium sp. S3T4]MBB5613719.1 hypothetical protein [Janthinobacterium sp. S3M3]
MSNSISTVPKSYQGIWRRTGIFRSDGRVDLTTSVWWFQSALFHIDLRIPQDRPRITAPAALASLPPGQLARIQAQTGFAGITVVEAERCEWRPEIAFPAISDEIDAGLMRFDTPDNLHESGIDASYQEDWLRAGAGAIHGARLDSLDGSGKIAYLIISGDHAAWACGVADAQFPATAGNEFSLLRRAHATAPWRIVTSNHGWLECGATMTLPTLKDSQPGQLISVDTERWRIDKIG